MRLRRIVAPMIACLAALGCGLLSASASAGTGPSLVGFASNSGTLSGATSVAVSGNYAYTTAYYAGQLTAVNISDPAHPVVAGFSPQLNNDMLNADTVTIAGGYAYVVSKNRNAGTTVADNGSGNALTILDVHTNPAQPAIVGQLQDAANLFGAYGVAVKNGFAFVPGQGCLGGGQPCPNLIPNSTPGNDFNVINVSNPASPTIAFTIQNPTSGPTDNALYHADSVAISGNYAYVTASYSNTLTVIDISNPSSPSIVKTLTDNTNLRFADDVAISGNYAYVAGETTPGRLAIVDISNPLGPKIVGSVSDPGLSGAYRVRVSGQYAYVSGSSSDALSIIDISNPTAPKVAATVTDSSHLHRTLGNDFALSGRYVISASPYLATESPGPYPPFPLQGGPTATGTVSVVDVDPNPVAVTITSPGSGAQYKRGQVVHATYSCAPGGLIALASCTGPVANGAPIDTATTGKHTFRVTGLDQDGRTGTATVTYTVGGPMVTGLRQSARKWREHGPKHANHKPPLGTTFTISLSQSAKVTLMFTQTARGRLVGGRCVAATKKNRHRPACSRTFVAGKLKINGRKGSNKVAFAGRVNGALLKPGRYTLVVTATAGGITSSRHTISFTIVVS